MRQLIVLTLLALTFFSCSSDDAPQTYQLEMRVESQGEFKVWWNYSGNPDADADWLTEPPMLHNMEFVRTATIEREDFYTLRVEPVNDTEYTVKIFIDGSVIEEETTNDYYFIDRTFFP